MSKTIEEINKIIDKIDENLPKGLGGDEAEEFLTEIIANLREVKKVTEEKYKEVVNKKTDEIKKGINKRLSETLSFTETQNALKEVKSGLEEVKTEINNLEEQLRKVSKSNESERKRLNANELLDGIHERGERWTTQSALRVGELLPDWARQVPGAEAVLGVATGTITGIVSTASGVATIGIHEFDKTTEDLKDLTQKSMDIGVSVYENTRKGAQEFASDAMHTTADSVENFRKGAENLVGKGMDNTAKVIEKGIEAVNVVGATTKVAEVLANKISESEEVKARAVAEAEIAKANAEVKKAEIQAQIEVARIQLEIAKLNKK